MRYYIAGPMTGLPDFNYPAFHAMEVKASQYGLVDNPARHFDGNQDLPRRDYMRAAVEALLGVDGIILLPGWAESPGAFLEAQIGEALELDFFDHDMKYIGTSPFQEVEIEPWD